MKKAGYEIFELETLNLIEEISLLSEAKNLASFHGSAHCNAVFMAEGTTLVDLVNENYWTELGHRLADSRNQNYRYFSYAGQFSDSIDINGVMNFVIHCE